MRQRQQAFRQGGNQDVFDLKSRKEKTAAPKPGPPQTDFKPKCYKL